jgi:hypothetical protein
MNECVILPIGWILTCILSLAGVIATLAGIIYSSLNSRLCAQDKIIDHQTAIIGKLQGDVERMSKGCGADGCHWRR